MSSNKKSLKVNKTKSQNQRSNNQQTTLNRIQDGTSKGFIGDRSTCIPRSATKSDGGRRSIHKVWPDLQLNQSHLFFECTLFLYSVLALFLQYLNLYRTLWWLPKSHWHYSLKYHLINPYLLSCIGLLLGVRVTKSFWDTISERIDFFTNGQDGWQLICWKVFEYAIVKTPTTTIVSTSFLFSFTRIYAEFGAKALISFVSPFALYILIFKSAPIVKVLKGLSSYALVQRVSRFLPSLLAPADDSSDCSENGSALIELDSFVHSCEATAFQIRKEAMLLLRDFELRCRYCIYTGFLTAYFAIFMPRFFLPRRTVSGEAQVMLVDDIWIAQLFSIVALTSFSLYVTYLFPINYFDLLYRCVVHLGHWELVQPTTVQQRIGNNSRSQGEHPNENCELYSEQSLPYQDGMRLFFKNEVYIARSHPHLRTVFAEPGNRFHSRLYKIAKNPVTLVSYLCMFQAGLVGFEFWLLLLTSDWQQIVTLVLLMFANYILFAKMFKDRVVIGRIYNPSEEDLQLIKQLQEENDKLRKEIERQKQEKSRGGGSKR